MSTPYFEVRRRELEQTMLWRGRRPDLEVLLTQARERAERGQFSLVKPTRPRRPRVCAAPAPKPTVTRPFNAKTLEAYEWCCYTRVLITAPAMAAALGITLDRAYGLITGFRRYGYLVHAGRLRRGMAPLEVWEWSDHGAGLG